MSHIPLTDDELRDLVSRCEGNFAAKQLALSYQSLRHEYTELNGHITLASTRAVLLNDA